MEVMGCIMITGDREEDEESPPRVSRKEDAHWIVVVLGGAPGRCSLEHLSSRAQLSWALLICETFVVRRPAS